MLLVEGALPTGYVAEPCFVNLGGGDLFMAYFRGPSHASSSGKLYGKKRINGVWGSEFLIWEHASYEVRNLIIGRDPASGRIGIIARYYSSGTHIGVHAIYSDDDGDSLSAPIDLATAFSGVPSSDYICPFGPIVKTSNGWMATFYAVRGATNAQYAYVLFSPDLESWANRKTIYSIGWAGTKLVEPFPVALDEDRIVWLIRDNKNGPRFLYIKSGDGGDTFGEIGGDWWASASPSIVPAPIAGIRTGEQIVSTWGARGIDGTADWGPFGALYATLVPVEAFWNRPSVAWRADAAARKIIAASVISGVGGAKWKEYGYTYPVNVEGEGAIVGWYDSKADANQTETVIWFSVI